MRIITGDYIFEAKNSLELPLVNGCLLVKVYQVANDEREDDFGVLKEFKTQQEARAMLQKIRKAFNAGEKEFKF